ncbi:FAD-linked oxidase [Kocuria dechangensis]|uniref:FAD-linked oxidase n=1 Tax=Kocuria dechangensis TaxID=1176249 RepID=A0A917GGN7_9MICC|nr:FAD-binding oxidoreductase [Kocuria dechangensis]GGG45230.1 FAD-linked oxidase [Kocuria dechangensis]
MISRTDVEDLVLQVCGPVLLPGDEGFAEEVSGFNLAAVHRPDVVVGADDAGDVITAVEWAAAHHEPVGVQATGHGADQPMDGGMLITTRRMQELEIDVPRRRARIGAGVRWRKVVDAIAPHGLAVLNGSSTHAGAVGYTLGGGLPVLGRVFGFAADWVRGLDVVTPDGRLRSVDAVHEPELFGLLLGGKGNLGIVTSMTLELVPLQGLYGGGIFYPGEDAQEVLGAFSRWAPELPACATTSVSLRWMPHDPAVDERLNHQLLVHLRFCWVGDPGEGARVLEPMRELSHPLLDTVGPMDYRDIDRVHLDATQPGLYVLTGEFLQDFDAAAIAVLLQLAGPGSGSPLPEVGIRLMGGAFSRPSAVADAVSGRDSAFFLELIGWLAPHVAERTPPALAAVLQGLAPWSTGRAFVNMHGVPGDEEERSRAWSREVYERLVRAKAVYDPENLLRFQHVVGQRR